LRTHIEVGARFRRRFWLAREDVLLSDPKGVVLAFHFAQLENHKLRRMPTVSSRFAQVEAPAE
jgi:hypothetical protein